MATTPADQARAESALRHAIVEAVHRGGLQHDPDRGIPVLAQCSEFGRREGELHRAAGWDRMTEVADIEAGRNAWARLRERERASWSDWLAVGHALAID